MVLKFRLECSWRSCFNDLPADVVAALRTAFAIRPTPASSFWHFITALVLRDLAVDGCRDGGVGVGELLLPDFSLENYLARGEIVCWGCWFVVVGV